MKLPFKLKNMKDKIKQIFDTTTSNGMREMTFERFEQAIDLVKKLQLNNAKAIAENEKINKKVEELIGKYREIGLTLTNTYLSAIDCKHNKQADLMKQDLDIYNEFISDLKTLKTE